MSQPKINPATGYVHYEEPEHAASVEPKVEDIPAEPEATEDAE